MDISYPLKYEGERRRNAQSDSRRIRERRERYAAQEREIRQEMQTGSKHRGIKKRIKLFSVRAGLDMPFLVLVLVLLVIGMVMMFSASYAVAYYENGDSYLYLKRQGIFALLGVAAMLGISFFDYHYFHKLSVIIMGISMFLMVLVLFLPAKNDIHRWIGFGLFTIQASEILKFAVILFMAHWGSVYFNRMETFKYGVAPALILWAVSACLLILEPHYSAIVIVTLLIAVMMFISGVKTKYFVIAGVALGVLFAIAYVTGILSYAMTRMEGWGQALIYTDADMWNTTWQTRNSMYAIGSGGLWGLGLGQSRQKYLYLPEPQNDFIFAIVCEELGLVGAFIILAIFGLLVWRGITISMRAKDKFGTLLGVGLTAQVGLQVVLNILVITDWLPNTGISLPFFSYGGSSLVMLLMQMGVILSISRTSNINKA